MPRMQLISLLLAFGQLPTPLQGQAARDSQIALENSHAVAGGVRKLAGKYLVLYTDVPSRPEVDRLPAIFDLAVPQWAAYFGVEVAKTNRWQAKAYLIGDRRRFETLRLLPPGHENFVNGISMGAELWLHDQPTDYYRRHLLLHEGTHVFMASFLGGCGPGWYMEGTAELFGTHRYDDQSDRLTLRIMPERREDVPMLGRIKLIRDAVAEGKVLPLPSVMKIDNRQQLGNEAYAWCWAAAKFLDSHPRYRDRFHDLYKNVLDPDFNATFRRVFDQDWRDLNAEWQAFVDTLDHGYDFDRMAIMFHPGEPALAGNRNVAQIAADRGWQSAGVRLEAGRAYKITASGRYQIAGESNGAAPWPCEPGGVTIEYHDRRPLGILIGAMDADAEGSPDGGGSFRDSFAIGLESFVKPTTTGTLYLRVNESAARLTDNRGGITVTIEPQ